VLFIKYLIDFFKINTHNQTVTFWVCQTFKTSGVSHPKQQAQGSDDPIQITPII